MAKKAMTKAGPQRRNKTSFASDSFIIRYSKSLITCSLVAVAVDVAVSVTEVESDFDSFFVLRL